MDTHRLRRVFDLLTLLCGSGPMTVTEISRRLDLPLSSTHDLVQALLAIDVVSAQAGGYTVGTRTLQLSAAVLDQHQRTQPTKGTT